MIETKKKVRGFARIVPERRSEIASAGGRASHRSGRAHEFTSAEASAAGRKGGLALAEKRRAERAKLEEEQERIRAALTAMGGDDDP